MLELKKEKNNEKLNYSIEIISTDSKIKILLPVFALPGVNEKAFPSGKG